MHLHGHDFAILAQMNGTEFNISRGMPELKLNNPPRRDTALLDSDGYLLIAFKPVSAGRCDDKNLGLRLMAGLRTILESGCFIVTS